MASPAPKPPCVPCATSLFDKTNLCLAVAAVLAATYVYYKSREITALYVAIGFGLFAFNIVDKYIGFIDMHHSIHLLIRVAGYVAFFAALYKLYGLTVRG